MAEEAYYTRSVDNDPASGPDDCDPELTNAFLVVPKFSLHEPDVTRTAAAAVVQRTPVNKPVEFVALKTNAINVLQKIGLLDVEKVRAAGTPVADLPKGSKRGLYAQLESIGMSAAFFPNDGARQNAVNELGDEYDFVPNFLLSLPSRVLMKSAAATRGQAPPVQREWPAISGVADAHAQGIRGAQVLIGVADTGVDADHVEFSHQTVPYRYVPLFPDDVPPRDVRGFDTEGHGSHVCGILAGKNVGVAPEAELNVASVIESETTRTSLIRVTYGLNWLLRKFRTPENERKPAVLNLSLGFPPNAALPPPEFQSRLRMLRTLLRTLIEANVLPVVAIGNDGPNHYRYPGAFKEVLAVGAIDFQNGMAPFSGSGSNEPGVTKPDLLGYGVEVYSSVERTFEGRPIYQRFNGTSMATPYAAGIAALYRCQYPTWPVEDVRKLMEDNALPIAKQPPGCAGLARYVNASSYAESSRTRAKPVAKKQRSAKK